MSTTENLIIEIITTIDPHQCVDTVDRTTANTIDYTTIDGERKTLTLNKHWGETINSLLLGEDPEGIITDAEENHQRINLGLYRNPADGLGEASTTLTIALNDFTKNVEIPAELPANFPLFERFHPATETMKTFRELAQLARDGADESELSAKEHELQLAVWRATGIVD